MMYFYEILYGDVIPFSLMFYDKKQLTKFQVRWQVPRGRYISVIILHGQLCFIETYKQSLYSTYTFYCATLYKMLPRDVSMKRMGSKNVDGHLLGSILTTTTHSWLAEEINLDWTLLDAMRD